MAYILIHKSYSGNKIPVEKEIRVNQSFLDHFDISGSSTALNQNVKPLTVNILLNHLTDILNFYKNSLDKRKFIEKPCLWATNKIIPELKKMDKNLLITIL